MIHKQNITKDDIVVGAFFKLKYKGILTVVEVIDNYVVRSVIKRGNKSEGFNDRIFELVNYFNETKAIKL